jgi:3-deoxy-manno-octulosonate cytidylyltransferase (CMP-KDO synthetase)
MIEHVYTRAAGFFGLARVVVLTDDERIAHAVESFGGEWEMTPVECASGTDRIAHAARAWDVDAVVNIQGDEPLIDPAMISAVAEHLKDHPADPIVTIAAPANPEAFRDPNTVKVVLSAQGYALYFSRAPIPHSRNLGGATPLQHVGLYGYQRKALLEIAGLPVSPLERSEGLEQLRALENGIPIRVLLGKSSAPGVDTPDDLDRVERLLGRAGSPA